MRPILFTLPFDIPVYAYGFMLTASVLIGRELTLWFAKRRGLDVALTDRCAIWTLAGAIIGARVLFVATNLNLFNSPLEVFAWWKGGVVAYGGFLGGLAGAIAFSRSHKFSLLRFADCVVPSLCVGLAITRVGCFLGGCDFGHEWNGPWAVQFPAGSPASMQQAHLGLLPTGRMDSLPVHPTQLYESLAGLALFGLVAMILRRRLLPGHALAVFAMGYGVLRYLIEIVRADAQRGSIGPWSTSQFIAITTFVAAMALLFVLRRQSANSSKLVPAHP